MGVLSLPAKAQTLFSRPYQPNQVAIETIVPDADDASGGTGTMFVTATASLTENIELATELPVARNGAGSGSSAVGNPYLGLGLSSTKVPFLLEVGTRLPTAPNNAASSIGRASSFARTPAFDPNELGLSTLVNRRLRLGRRSSLRLRSGLSYTSRESGPTNDRSRDWIFHYEGQVWREGDRLITGLTFTGRALLTSPGTANHHAGLSLMGNWNRVQPGLLLGTALDPLFDRNELAPYVGITLSISYGRF